MFLLKRSAIVRGGGGGFPPSIQLFLSRFFLSLSPLLLSSHHHPREYDQYTRAVRTTSAPDYKRPPNSTAFGSVFIRFIYVFFFFDISFPLSRPPLVSSVLFGFSPYRPKDLRDTTGEQNKQVIPVQDTPLLKVVFNNDIQMRRLYYYYKSKTIKFIIIVVILNGRRSSGRFVKNPEKQI